MFGNLTPLEETRAYKELVALGWEKGRAEGRAEGREEGRRAEACALILRQSKRRFGALSPQLEEGIQALPLARLEALAEALLDFTAVPDLRDWLARD